jgi:hypothetical protein
MRPVCEGRVKRNQGLRRMTAIQMDPINALDATFSEIYIVQ